MRLDLPPWTKVDVLRSLPTDRRWVAAMTVMPGGRFQESTVTADEIVVVLPEDYTGYWELQLQSNDDTILILAEGRKLPPLGDEMSPGRWWRVLAPDGSLWAEASDEEDVRSRVRPGDRLQRLHEVTHREWRDER